MVGTTVSSIGVVQLEICIKGNKTKSQKIDVDKYKTWKHFGKMHKKLRNNIKDIII